ncbi:MAG: aminopeptidase N [Gammaproteobacteria bacterium]|nr:aminopeptidase N [Gammaproteobacteria bacterium]
MKDAAPKSIYLKDYQPPAFQIDTTDLRFELGEESTLVISKLTMHRTPIFAGHTSAPLVLDGQDMVLEKLFLDGVALTPKDYRIEEESLTIFELPKAVNDNGASFVLECHTRIKPQENTSLEGLYKSKKMFCTQCEAEGFRKITYYLDRPDVMSSFTTTVVADKKRYPVLLSNGNPISVGACPASDSNSVEATHHFATWQDPFRKPCYLFALVAGDLEHVEDTFTTMSGRTITLRIFVESKDLDKCDHGMLSLKNAMRWDEEVFGREYDLDIFMIVAVDDFNMGAMENKGLNIFNTSCVLANPATTTDAGFQRVEAVVAHEYFHNWSGNRVTCRDWFQLSLKEGFTVFRDAEFSADMGSRTVKRIDDVSFLRTTQFAEDAGPMAHSVRPDSYMEISNFYTVTIYEKGAEVVRMIRELIGPERFRKGSDLYFKRHDGQAVTTEDFVKAMEEAGSIDLTQFRRWYSQAGTPVLRARGQFDPSYSTYQLTVEQSCPPTPEQPIKQPFHIPLRMALLDRDGNELPLLLEGEDPGEARNERVLDVRDKVHHFVFTGIEHAPVPSLLRGFSAPLKLQVAYTREELLFLMAHDTDGFNRWNAAQQLGVEVLQDLLKDYQANRELTLEQGVIDAFDSILQMSINKAERDEEQDKEAVAQLLTLPTEAYLSELADEIDVAGIHAVREFASNTLARALASKFAALYDMNSTPEPYAADAAGIARRALKNVSLSYLMRTEDPQWLQTCHAQYEQADNMTDVSAALRLFVNSEMPQAEPLRQQALQSFYAKWQHEALVVDQWFSVQATSTLPGTLDRVTKLMEHPAFDIKNPNKVRALISAFANGNPVQFHDKSGAGYGFLADRIIELDGLNPQIASRLVTPLTRWRKYDEGRQGMMRGALERVSAKDGLSKDVGEVVGKSLR